MSLRPKLMLSQSSCASRKPTSVRKQLHFRCECLGTAAAVSAEFDPELASRCCHEVYTSTYYTLQVLTTKFDEQSRKDQALIGSQKQALTEKEATLQVRPMLQRQQLQQKVVAVTFVVVTPMHCIY